MLASITVGVVATGFVSVLNGYFASRVGATRSALVSYLVPVVALVLGVVFRGEVIHAVAALGIALVVAGAILASRREASGGRVTSS